MSPPQCILLSTRNREIFTQNIFTINFFHVFILCITHEMFSTMKIKVYHYLWYILLDKTGKGHGTND